VERALADLDAGYGANEISLLVSATEAHTRKNLETATRAEQWQNIADMVKAANGRFRMVGTVSVAFGCPFRGQGRRRVGHRGRRALRPAWRRARRLG
jgi:hydroxymethylglutaryl-CoA lyase